MCSYGCGRWLPENSAELYYHIKIHNADKEANLLSMQMDLASRQLEKIKHEK